VNAALPWRERTDGRELSAPVYGEHFVDQVVVQGLEIGMRHRFGEAGGVDKDVQTPVAPFDLSTQRLQHVRPRYVGDQRGVALSG
jgi:hypothetical protein